MSLDVWMRGDLARILTTLSSIKLREVNAALVMRLGEVAYHTGYLIALFDMAKAVGIITEEVAAEIDTQERNFNSSQGERM